MDTLRLVRIFVASASDVVDEREHVDDAVARLNAGEARRKGVRFEAVGWRDASPREGRPEQVILDQFSPDTWDIFIVIMWHKFGTPTGAARPSGEPYESGTDEEFERAHEQRSRSGRPTIMLYRRTGPTDLSTVDTEQLAKVNAFFERNRNRGLYHEYAEHDFRDRVFDHLSSTIDEFAPGIPAGHNAEVARPPASGKRQSPVDLESPLMHSLYQLSFEGLESWMPDEPLGITWREYGFRLSWVPLTVLFAWTPCNPGLMEAATDRLLGLKLVEPSRRHFDNPRAFMVVVDDNSVIQTAIVRQKSGTVIQIVYTKTLRTESLTVGAGTWDGSTFNGKTVAFETQAVGRLNHLRLTDKGIELWEKQRAQR